MERNLQTKYADYNRSSDTLPSYPKGRAWVGLGAQILQTPYREIYEALSFLSTHPPKSFLDLGAGFGRLAFVLKALYPQCRFTGYEFVPERVAEGRRVLELNGLDPQSLEERNILEASDLPIADIYFAYDFGSPRDIEELLRKFEALFSKHNFFLIVKGKATRSMIHNKFPLLFRANGSKHFENLSIYSSFFELS